MLDSPTCDVTDRVIGLVSHILARNTDSQPVVSTSCQLSDMGLSSIDMVNLMLAVEAEFDITIPQSQLTAANFRSVETIERLVDQLQPS
jgi:acyl carrier protein